MTRARLAVMLALGGLYLGGLGVLSGVLLERMRFDVQRTAVLARLAATEDRLHARLMQLERGTLHPGERPGFAADDGRRREQPQPL